MPNFAISDGLKIINVIIADSQEEAESITQMQAIQTDGEPWIDWFFEDGIWKMPKPYPSWIWQDGQWEPPTPMPAEEGFYFTWNEDSLSWDRHEIILENTILDNGEANADSV